MTRPILLCVGGPLHATWRVDYDERMGCVAVDLGQALPQMDGGLLYGLPAAQTYKRFFYRPWRPQVMGPLPADVDVDKFKRDLAIGLEGAVTIAEACRHRKVLILAELIRPENSPLDACAMYADALYRGLAQPTPRPLNGAPANTEVHPCS